jgi:hypothetical protein
MASWAETINSIGIPLVADEGAVKVKCGSA